MLKIFMMHTLVFTCCLVNTAQDCNYWRNRIDPSVKTNQKFVSELGEKEVLSGMKCLLQQQGNKRQGLVLRSEAEVSQILPVPTVEVSALYYISFLFNGNHEFARAVALIGDPPRLRGEYERLEFNSSTDLKRAYSSYRRWFKTVNSIGLEESRRRKFDPLANSGVRWY